MPSGVRLTEADRKMIERKWQVGLSFAEIARQTKLSVPAVRRVVRAVSPVDKVPKR